MTEEACFYFPAEVHHILHVREVVNKICLEMGFTPHDSGLIITAIWEAALNAVTHGSPGGIKDHVTVRITADDDVLKVRITSRNRNFNLPDNKPNLVPTSKRGRGLPIIYAFMDEVKLIEDEDGITMHLMKRLPQSTASLGT